MTITAVLCVRNEGAFLLDWLAHHLACGVSHVVALSNDCADGTDLILDRLESLGHVTHIRNDGPYDARGIQFSGLARADKTAAVQDADWLLALDIDEFVNVHVGNRTLPALVDAVPEATAITLTWRLFGNAGIVAYQDRPVTRQFTRAAPEILHWPWRAALFKTLYRNDGTYQALGVHRPRRPDDARLAGACWVDGNGAPLPALYRTKRLFSNFGKPLYGLAQLNHYPLGAMESYLLKVDRGRAVHAADRLGMDYWCERNFNCEEDLSILALDGVDEQRAVFDRDPALRRLHDAAVAWRHERCQALLTEERYRALMGRLMMTPASRPLTAARSESLRRHASRATR